LYSPESIQIAKIWPVVYQIYPCSALDSVKFSNVRNTGITRRAVDYTDSLINRKDHALILLYWS